MRIGNWELSIGQICFDLTNAQFSIPNSHPKGLLPNRKQDVVRADKHSSARYGR